MGTALHDGTPVRASSGIAITWLRAALARLPRHTHPRRMSAIFHPDSGTPDTAERIRHRRDLEMSGRPLMVLIGGATGVGKSTVATRLGHALGITRVLGTDFVREILRSVVAEALGPELSRSSFELDRDHADGAAPHAEFERQARQVLVGVRAEMQRAADEGTSIILEGIHLVPGLVDLHAAHDGIVVQVVLSVDDERDHERRFHTRARSSHRPAERYDDGIGCIRALQDHAVALARTAHVPVIENRNEETTVRRLLELVSTAVSRALRAG